MSAPDTPRAMYLHGPGAPVFAFLHRGVDPARATAVLLCPPFGWEDMCSYRIRREWAEQLARRGHTTLRIDLPGSGDSGGSPTDPGQLDAWTQAVDGAARWLREAQGAQRVAAIGIGLGGIVCCRAALGDAPIDELVLWSVPARGQRIMRELRAFAAMETASNADAAQDAPVAGAADDGTLVANGYLLSAETVAQLETLDLGEARLGSPATRRALLLGRDGLRVDKDLRAALERAGADVTVRDGPGFGAMMVEPQDARAPTEVFELVSLWLDEDDEGRGASLPPAAAPSQTLAPSQWTDHEEALFEHAGVSLRERPLAFNGPGGELFGVLTEPLGAQRQLTAVLLNAGPQRRTGPNRMWVELARRWAANGVPTLRLDADGIGDAHGDSTVLGRVTAFYRAHYIDEARAALQALTDRGLPQRFVMLGLCSGAYWSAHAAIADERVARVIMLNPTTLVFDEWRHTVRRARLLRERALMASTWRKVFRGEIMLSKHLETGRTLVGRAASGPMRARERLLAGTRSAPVPDTHAATVHEPVEDLFDALGDRGQRALLLYTDGEVLCEELTEKGVFDHLERWPNLELARIETVVNTHTLTPLWLQRRVHALLDRVLEDELGRLAA